MSPHLFPDVQPFLEAVKNCGIRMGLFTNGNANISDCTVLSPYFSLLLGGADVGASKPSPAGFVACAQLTGFKPARTLYIGDSYEKDIVGAKKCGMLTALILREDRSNCDAPNGSSGVQTAADVMASAAANAYPDADMVLTSLQWEEVKQHLHQIISHQTTP